MEDENNTIVNLMLTVKWHISKSFLFVAISSLSYCSGKDLIDREETGGGTLSSILLDILRQSQY